MLSIYTRFIHLLKPFPLSPLQLTLHNITVTLLGLRLDITGMGILDAIVEGVFGVGHRLRMHGMG